MRRDDTSPKKEREIRHVATLIFFSSRRRHTSWPRDWSSGVCSSDLRTELEKLLAQPPKGDKASRGLGDLVIAGPAPAPLARAETFYRYQLMLRTRAMTRLSRAIARSEERRVGKVGRWTIDRHLDSME